MSTENLPWEPIRLKSGKIYKACKVAYHGGRIFLSTGFSKALNEMNKSCSGRKWCGFDTPPKKHWSFKDDARTRFTLELMQGNNPYKVYDQALDTSFEMPAIHRDHPRMPPYDHQYEMFYHALTYRATVMACEMGSGKSRVAIMVADWLANHKDLTTEEFWFVGPVSAVKAVSRELVKWKCPVKPMMFTYNKFVTFLEDYEGKPPRLLVCDESSRLKTWTAQRTMAVAHCVEAMRREYAADNQWVMLMSGTPAPKTAVDWWSQSELACPGFLKENTPAALRHSLCLIEQRENQMSGGTYPHLVAWFDDEKKCKVCGGLEGDYDHDVMSSKYHQFQPSVNEVARLYKRLQGLVIVKFKKDCLDLPDKARILVRVKPSPDTVRAASIIRNGDHRAPQRLMYIRELSDGFQYREVQDGMKECTRCLGAKRIQDFVSDQAGNNETGQEDLEQYEQREVTCPNCEGTGQIANMVPDTAYVDCPKDGLLKHLLNQYEEYGRFVVWGGFTGTIDRLVDVVTQHGWTVLRIDGRGLSVHTTMDLDISSDEMLDAMDYSNEQFAALLRKHPKVCVIAHPKAGGMAYTFTGAPADLFYSNDFDGEAKMQAGDRIHRAGMSMNRGCTSYECIHLPEDLMVIDNLDTKRDMQNMTLGELQSFKPDYNRCHMFDGDDILPPKEK